MKVRIASVQFHPVLYEVEANLLKMDNFVVRAVREKADVIVFPENFLTGPVRGRPDLIDDRCFLLNEVQRVARHYHIDIVAGSLVERRDGKNYNTSYYVDRYGRVLGRYSKINLWLTEREYITRGCTPCVLRTSYAKVGLSICWDLAFPELYRFYARQGVEIVFTVSFWGLEDAGPGQRFDPRSEQKFIDACCVARAFENEMIVVYANVAGDYTIGGKPLHSAGRTQIVMPFAGAVRRLTHSREAMFVAEVDTSIIRTAEQAYEIRRDLKGHLRQGLPGSGM